MLLHETIHEFGLEALVADQELALARQVHAEYYLGLAVDSLEGPELAAWLRQLGREYANLRAALQWALEQPASEMALQLERALVHFWEGRRRLSAGSTSPERALADSQDGLVPASASVLLNPGAMIFNQGDWEQVGARVWEAGTAPRTPGDARRLARSLCLLGVITWVIGDVSLARLYAEEGLASARDLDEKVTLAYLTDLSGQIALEQGEDSQARTLLEEGLALHREADDRLGSLNALFFLERLLSALGDVTQARLYARDHLAIAREIGYQPGIVGALVFLGRLALEEGNVIEAGRLFEESLALLREMKENASLTVATNLQGIGVTLAALGRLGEAVRLWGAAEALYALLPEERAFVARARMTARAALGEEAFTITWAEGRAMTLEQALAAVGKIARSGQPAAQATRSAGRARHQLPSLSTTGNLTEREVEVLRLVAQGLSDAQIAEMLVISPRTVNAHLRSIYAKLHISSRNAATYFALEHDLI